MVVNQDLDQIVTPVKAQKLGELLRMVGYPTYKIEYLVTGFTQGFRISHEGDLPPGYPKNHKIANDHPDL